MKHFIITLLSAMALSVSGFVFAGGAVVEAPEPAVETNPAVQQAPIEEEVVEAAECDADKADCDAEETAEVSTEDDMKEDAAS